MVNFHASSENGKEVVIGSVEVRCSYQSRKKWKGDLIVRLYKVLFELGASVLHNMSHHPTLDGDHTQIHVMVSERTRWAVLRWLETNMPSTIGLPGLGGLVAAECRTNRWSWCGVHPVRSDGFGVTCACTVTVNVTSIFKWPLGAPRELPEMQKTKQGLF